MLVCVVLAALSAAILPTVPSYDPWSWIVWGHEVFDPHTSFIVNGGPSWKPLPMIFTTIYGLLGGAAPTLWVITARVGGLLALWGTWQLTSRLAGGGWLGAFAGLLAAIGIVLTGRQDQAWYYYFLHGTSEAILVAVAVWAADRLLDGRHLQAYLIMVAGGLIRPEWWPFLGLYAIWLWFRDPGFKSPAMRLVLLAGLAVQPVGWFVPPWVTTGQPFLAATHAADYNGHLGSDVLSVDPGPRGPRPAPARADPGGGGGGHRLGARPQPCDSGHRRRHRRRGGWWSSARRSTATRAWSASSCPLPRSPRARRRRPRPAGPAGGRAGRLAAPPGDGGRGRRPGRGVHPVQHRPDQRRARDERDASQGVHLLDTLTQAVAAAGGKAGVLPCPSSFTAVNHSAQTALAWKLGVTLQRVGTSMRAPGVDFIGPKAAQIGGPAKIDPRLTRAETVAGPDRGAWCV